MEQILLHVVVIFLVEQVEEAPALAAHLSIEVWLCGAAGALAIINLDILHGPEVGVANLLYLAD